VYFEVNGVKYWIMSGPSGLLVYKKEGSKTRYLGRRSIAEIKEMLAKADTETLQRIKSDIEAVKQVVESQKPAQTAQTPSLTWKKDGHTYWLLQFGQTFYIYMKGPSTKHRPKLVEKTDINGVINRVLAAGALHVLEALRLIINGLHAAVSDLQKPQAKPQAPAAEARRETPHREAQVSRREAEAALKELRRWLRKEVEAWREKYRRRMEREGLYEADPGWVREDLAEFVREYRHLVEKILPHQDLLDKLADAVVEAAAGRLTRSDALEILK
jgi:hypothetical protein